MNTNDFKDRILDIEKRLEASRQAPSEKNPASSARELYFELQRLVRTRDALSASSSGKLN